MVMDGYVRVSQVRGRDGESFISPDAQRDQIEGWARLRNVTVGEWHVDLDQSGGKADRPAFLEAMRRVEAGESGGIIVAKLDRFARSLPQAMEAIQRLDHAGGTIVSVAEGIDPGTPAGKMMQRLLLVLAEWELDRIRDSWRDARRRAVLRGVHVASATPTGYLRDETGRLYPHPVHAIAVRDLFRRRAAGESWRNLGRFLDEHGVEGPYGALNWRTRAVSRIVQNRVYLGEAFSGEFRNVDAHEPLVDRVTWERAQTAKGAPSDRGQGAVLAGLLRCAGCRHVMKPDKMTVADGTRVRIYRCRGEHASGRCEDRAAVMGRVIEPHVARLALGRAREFVVDAQEATAETDDAELGLAAAEAELVAYRDDERIVGALGHDRYVEGLRRRAATVDEALERLLAARAARSPAALQAANMRDVWPDLEDRQKRRMLGAVIDAVFLRSGRKLPIEDRTLVLWRGEAPADLPRRGLRRVPLRPFDWPDGPVNPGVALAHDLDEGAL